MAPAPQQTTNPTGQTTADSILSGALAATANLTLGSGDGMFVASSAPAVGSNGSTPIGRILARALNSLQSNASATPAAPATSNPVTDATLSTPATTPAIPSVTSALLAAVTHDGSTSTAPVVSAASAASLPPALTSFLSSFSNALAVVDSAPSANVNKSADADGNASLLATTVLSNNAPTVSAFLPIQPPFSIDGSNANAPQQTANPTASAPAVDPNSVVDQVLKGAFFQTVGQTSSVRLSLVPASLGDVSVKLTVDGGNVSAQMVAQTPAAHDALVAGQAQLSQSLADAGLKLTSFNVSLAGGFAGFQQQQHSSTQSQSSGRRIASIGGVDTADEDDDASLSAVPTFGPPILTGHNFGSLNYLA